VSLHLITAHLEISHVYVLTNFKVEPWIISNKKDLRTSRQDSGVSAQLCGDSKHGNEGSHYCRTRFGKKLKNTLGTAEDKLPLNRLKE
jgi:hypothetical protein